MKRYSDLFTLSESLSHVISMATKDDVHTMQAAGRCNLPAVHSTIVKELAPEGVLGVSRCAVWLEAV